MNVQRNQYLRDVETRLQRLPQIDREQEMAEITQHLDSLIAARQSDGQTETAATQSAVAQFGTAREIGGALTQAGANLRFTSVWEIALFCAPVVALLSAVWFALLYAQGVVHFWRDTASDNPAASTLHTVFAVYGTYVLSWLAGFAACITLVLRYGIRGVLRLAVRPSPALNDAVRWLLLNFLIGKIGPLLITQALVVPTEFSLLNVYGSAGVFYQVLWLLTMWASAYIVGRTSRTQAEAGVVRSVGASSALGTTYVILFVVLCAVSDRAAYSSHRSATEQMITIGTAVGTAVFWIVLNFLVVCCLARWGAQSRPISISRTEAWYEPAV